MELVICYAVRINYFFTIFVVDNLHFWMTQGKRPVGRPRRRWEDNIKTDLEEVGRGYWDWMELAKDRDSWRALVSTVMNFPVP